VGTDPSSPIDSLAALGEWSAVAQPWCTLLYSGAITDGHRGERLAPIGELAAAGVRVFSDGGSGVADSDLLRHAFDYGRAFDAVFAVHPEDPSLGRGGAMHEGLWSGRLGVAGRPAAAELIGVQRLLALCELTGARLLVHRISTAAGAALLAGAAEVGLPVTSSVTPQHLTFADSDCSGYDTNRRFNPPLRPESDVEALRAAAESGAIDVVVSDHVPRVAQAKELPFDQAPTGSVGLETTLGVLLGEVGLPVVQVFELLSRRPSEILGLPVGDTLEPGAPADLCIVDPTAQWTVGGAELASRSKNTAFEGRRLTGRVRHTVRTGQPVVIDGKGQW
ncbi:MAG: amidohydrolase family protein, partial [Actinomycetota bacterium]|nr:amidohydrolase family protein [Actinomycetota bacterium]